MTLSELSPLCQDPRVLAYAGQFSASLESASRLCHTLDHGRGVRRQFNGILLAILSDLVKGARPMRIPSGE